MLSNEMKDSGAKQVLQSKVVKSPSSYFNQQMPVKMSAELAGNITKEAKVQHTRDFKAYLNQLQREESKSTTLLTKVPKQQQREHLPSNLIDLGSNMFSQPSLKPFNDRKVLINNRTNSTNKRLKEEEVRFGETSYLPNVQTEQTKTS